LRWFTPRVEVPLCGHATLASAAVVIERLEPGRTEVVFQSRSGPLRVERDGSRYLMDFPARPSQTITPPTALAEALGAVAVEVRVNSFNYLAVLDGSEAVRALAPDLAAVASLDRPGVIVTAAGEEPYDFISRYFAPAKGIAEDPVTGAAHCMLAPYWSERLGKTAFRAFQASARGGEVGCRIAGDRVVLEGACVFYLSGEIVI
jgi:PhzF family phenazine biosynthesis protein